MSEDKVELLSTPYGEVAYESFRELGFALRTGKKEHSSLSGSVASEKIR